MNKIFELTGNWDCEARFEREDGARGSRRLERDHVTRGESAPESESETWPKLDQSINALLSTYVQKIALKSD